MICIKFSGMFQTLELKLLYLYINIQWTNLGELICSIAVKPLPATLATPMFKPQPFYL